jgi:hypothetical protein
VLVCPDLLLVRCIDFRLCYEQHGLTVSGCADLELVLCDRWWCRQGRGPQISGLASLITFTEPALETLYFKTKHDLLCCKFLLFDT